jgi:hypothetical protein
MIVLYYNHKPLGSIRKPSLVRRDSIISFFGIAPGTEVAEAAEATERPNSTELSLIVK